MAWQSRAGNGGWIMARREPDDADEHIEEPTRRPARRPPPRSEDDDEPPRRRRRPVDEGGEYEEDRPRRPRSAVSSIIPYRNGMALASYYCGMGALIVTLGSIALSIVAAGVMNRWIFLALFAGVGGLLALLAVIFGIMGIANTKRTPEVGGTAHAIIGIILGGLEILGILLVSIGVISIR
jgi:hypothetical protein